MFVRRLLATGLVELVPPIADQSPDPVADLTAWLGRHARQGTARLDRKLAARPGFGDGIGLGHEDSYTGGGIDLGGRNPEQSNVPTIAHTQGGMQVPLGVSPQGYLHHRRRITTRTCRSAPPVPLLLDAAQHFECLFGICIDRHPRPSPFERTFGTCHRAIPRVGGVDQVLLSISRIDTAHQQARVDETGSCRSDAGSVSHQFT